MAWSTERGENDFTRAVAAVAPENGRWRSTDQIPERTVEAGLITDFMRVTGGLRYDSFIFKVDSTIAANSGKASDRIASPKLAIVLGPWAIASRMASPRPFHPVEPRTLRLTLKARW